MRNQNLKAHWYNESCLPKVKQSIEKQENSIVNKEKITELLCNIDSPI